MVRETALVAMEIYSSFEGIVVFRHFLTSIDTIEILDSKFSPLRTADTGRQSMIRRKPASDKFSYDSAT